MAFAQSDTLQSDLDAARSDAKLIGLAAVVMVDGKTVEKGASGVRRKGNDDALTPDDLFHMGSIGKSMSASVIARLVERGELDWDDTVGERLPELAAQIDAGWHKVTLDQLLGHRSGLPAMGIKQLFQGDTSEDTPPETRERIMVGLLSKPPKVAPDSEFAYRNSGYVLASMIAEAVTGKVWEELVIQELAEPLELNSLGFGAPPIDGPWGHRKMGPFKFSMSPLDGADNPPFMAAAGTLHMSLHDLAHYGQTHLERDPNYLKSTTFARLHEPALEDYAYGWVVSTGQDWANGPVIWHNGSNTLWYAVIAFIPEKNMVIAIAANDGDIRRADPAFATLLETIGERYP